MTKGLHELAPELWESGFPNLIRWALYEGGYSTRSAIAAASYVQITALPGIGEATAAVISQWAPGGRLASDVKSRRQEREQREATFEREWAQRLRSRGYTVTKGAE